MNFFKKNPIQDSITQIDAMIQTFVHQRSSAPMLMSKDQLLLMKALLEKSMGDYNNINPEFMKTAPILLNYINMSLLLYFGT